MDKSYEDEWWNLAEHIWNLMVAKLETIQATIPWNDIVPEIARVWNWKIAENFISENNSPILNKSAKSVRLGSWNPSEAPPFFGNNSFRFNHHEEEGEHESTEGRQ